MTIGDILIQTNQANLDTMLPLTAVQTSADIERYYKEGYSVGMTASDFAKKYPRLPIERIYAAHNMLASFYYCELDNPIVPIVLSLNIYGGKRLAMNGELDEKFQQRVLDTAEKISSGNISFIRSYLFPWKTVFVYRFFPNTLSCPIPVRTYMFSFLTCIAPVILAFLPSVRMACKRFLLENLKSKSKILKKSCPACRML